MKKITLFAFALLSGFWCVAQPTFEAATSFAKMQDLTYDATVQNKLYAITNGNHIVVSTDNGANWNVLYSFPGQAFFKDLKLAPGNQSLSFATMDTIYLLSLATGQITASFPVPENNVEGAGPSYYTSYSFFDASGTTILADTGFPFGFSSQGKTFITKDGGQVWTEIYYTFDNENIFVNDVAINPTNSSQIILARGNGDSGTIGGLLVSNNSGSTFTEKIPGITLDAITFHPTNSNEFYVGSSIGFGAHPENIFHSTDSGETFTTAAITWNDQTLNNITKIVINPANTNRIIALEENEIVRSNDGGVTWTTTLYEAGVAMDYYYGINASFNPFDENQVAVTTDFYPQSLNWTSNVLAQIQAPFFNIVSVSVGKYGSDAHLYYGAQGGRIHKNITTVVTSIYETEQADSFNPKRNYVIADETVPGRLFTYASGGFFGGFLNVSTDFGATKTNILQAFSDDIQELTIDPNNTNIIYVSMRSGESSSITKVDFSNLSDIITTTIETPQVTEFGEGVVTGIVFGTTTDEIIIAKKTSVFKSTDGGATWAEIGAGLDGITDNDLIWDMASNPLNANQLTIGSSAGVYTSMDRGENWTLVLPGIDAKRIKHSPLNDGVIAVTVFSTQFVDASIVYTSDNGENWTTVTPESLLYVASYGMDYDFDGENINAYLATSDLGVIKYVIEDVTLKTNNPVAAATAGIYPNPASGLVSVFTKDKAAVTSVRVYSLTGQKVMESNSAQFNIASLSKGLYIVKAKTANGESIAKLIKE